MAYALTEVVRNIQGTVVVGKVETAEETILVWGSLDPKEPLTDLNFGEADVNAFGQFKRPATIPLWVENGSDVAFALGVDVTDVKVDGRPVGNVLALDFSRLPVDVVVPAEPVKAAPIAEPAARPVLETAPISPAGSGVVPANGAPSPPITEATPRPTPTPSRPLPAFAVINHGQTAAYMVSLRFLRTPRDLGLDTGAQVTFTARFRAQGPVLPIPTPTPYPTATVAPTEPPIVIGKRGGNPSLQMSRPVAHWSPHECGSTTRCLTPLAPLYNGLVEYNPETDDRFDIRGDLAIKWDLRGDGGQWTFFLDKNARWQDGTSVTAPDVVFSLNSMVDPDQTRPQVGAIRPFYESSEVIDDYTVAVYTHFPAGPLLSYLASDHFKILPKHHVESGVDMRLEENINGSGPFLLSDHEPEVQVVYKRNSEYFKDRYPYFDVMTYFIVTDQDTTMAAFRAGQVLGHVHPFNGLSNSQNQELAELARDEGRVLWQGPMALFFLNMNAGKPPFDDARVRRALNLVTHREPFIAEFAAGMGLLGGPFPPNTWFSLSEEELLRMPGYRTSSGGGTHPDDVAEARRLMEEAGLADRGFEVGILAPNISSSRVSAKWVYNTSALDVAPRSASSPYGRGLR